MTPDMSGGQAGSGGFDCVVDFVGRDRVVVLRVGVLGLVASAADAVDRLEAGDAGELSIHCVHDHDAPTGRCWP
jgi:hypothetical protein